MKIKKNLWRESLLCLKKKKKKKKVENLNLGIKIKEQLRWRWLTGGALLESKLSCWPVKPTKEIRTLSLGVCVSLLSQWMSLWHQNTEDEVEGPVCRELSIVSEKKGLQWLVDLEKTLQPLLASSLLISNFSFSISSSWYYRISYLSTRKVVSVENLTGLFPSTWVTLVTCMLQ